MDSAVINIRVEPGLKAEAKKLADDLGLSLSSLIHACLKKVVAEKTVTLSSYEPTPYLEKILKESMAEIKAGKTISFKNSQDAIKYLDEIIAKDKRKNGRKN